MCGVAACQINGVFADIGCAEKRPWYHPVATQPHSVDGWISLVKNMFFDDLRQKDVIRILQYVTTHTIIHGTGIWISTCFFHENQAFFWIGGFIPLPWMVIHALDFSVFFRPPTEPTPPRFLCQSICHSLPADDKCQGCPGAQVFFLISRPRKMVKDWDVFFSGGPLRSL